MKIWKFFLLATFAFAISCQKNKKFEAFKAEKPSHKWIFFTHKGIYTVKIPWRDKTRKVYILYPTQFIKKGNVLLLHGWNLPALEWCDETQIDEELRKYGFAIIIPDMGKSIYASQMYPQTLPVFRQQPLLTWLKDTVLPYLQDTLKMMLADENNFIVGLSTGARGAFALALNDPDLFKGIGLLSGDYDQTLNPNDNLMIYFYGDYAQYPMRWEGKDNLVREFLRKFQQEKKCFLPPIYLAHGMDDPVVSVIQSDTLTSLLLKASCEVQYRFLLNEKHDYKFWEKQTPFLINFILSHSK